MKRNRRRFPVCILALLACMLLVLSGCSRDYTAGDSAAFVRSVADAVTFREDTPDLFLSDGDILTDLTAEPVFQPYFSIIDMKAQTDEADPLLVHYTCRIPGPVGVCFNMAYNRYFQMNEMFSPFVEVSGDVRIAENDGKRQIDISERDNVFAAYAALRYINPLYFSLNGVDISGGVTDSNYTDVMNVLLSQANGAYASLRGMTPAEHSSEKLIPELEQYNAQFKNLSRVSNTSGYGWRNAIRAWIAGNTTTVWIVAGFVGLLILYFAGIKLWDVIDRARGGKKKRSSAAKKPVKKKKQRKPAAPSRFTKWELDRFMAQYAEKPGYPSEDDVHTAAKEAVRIALDPEKAENSEDTLRFLCRNIHFGLSYQRIGSGEHVKESTRQEMLTCAGWSAAALGRLLALKMDPDEIPKNRERLEKAVDQINKTVEQLQSLIKKRNSILSLMKDENVVLQGDDLNKQLQEFPTLGAKIDELDCKYNQGIGGFMLDNGDLPLAYLIFLLGDSQNQVPRFIKQGVIMGLVDWLVKNRSHRAAGELLKTVVAVRADMIQSDRELTFFEVRAPHGTRQEEYARMLADVLHCSNPSLQYGDTRKLLENAEKEVPGVLDMLCTYPLRLIDPVNKQTMGFYRFKPYVHAAWVNYIPPEGSGTVIRRYHEVDDRTKPLSSGLNLSLFRDTLAVIPTLFHEYQHYRGDRNEASVFLKTQLFSIRFYKAHKDADAKADDVFTRLTTLLGLPPKAAKLNEFNALIGKYYGTQLPEKEAKRKADSEINLLNMNIDMSNAKQTWDPEKKLPRLSDDEDAENKNLIRNILIRFATVPKSLDKASFERILKHKPSSPDELIETPLSSAMQRVANFHGLQHGAETWLLDILKNQADYGDGNANLLDTLREANASPSKLVSQLDGHIPDKAVRNPKTLPKYLKLAEKHARNRGGDTVDTGDLAAVMLEKPTPAMKAAGIGKKAG